MRKLIAAAGLAAAGVLASGAQASVIPVLDSVTPDGLDWLFAYTGTLAEDQGMVNGSTLIIYDFEGYVPGSIDAGALPFTTSVEFTSALLPPPGHMDDPTILNLKFVWHGGPFHASGGPFTDTDFSGLSAKSIYSAVTLGSFSARTVTNNGKAVGAAAFNSGEVGVPTATIPEPEAWALMILGFSGMGALLRSRRRQAPA